MHWNLMGQGTSATTRVGYVWLEFGFPGASEPWFTCGCRLQASTHTTTVHSDYFTTRLRISTTDGMSLVTEAGQPLTKAALEEILGDQGTVYGHAGDYRTAVRAALFPGLSEQRYDALITALLQLRMPKLSQRLDPALLSTLLSRALPPLGQQEIADLAEGFERLDQQRERLAALEEEIAATAILAGRQRTYARRVLRAGSAALISATTTMDNLARAAKASAEEYDIVAARKAEQQQLIRDSKTATSNCEAEIAGMTESDAYKQGTELDQLRQRVAEEGRRAIGIRADARLQRSEADSDETQSRAAECECEQRAGSVRVLESETMHAAVRAGMASLQGEIAEVSGTEDARPRQLLRAAVEARHEQIAGVRNSLDEHDRSVARRQDAEDELEVASAVLTTARAQRETAAKGYELALTELTARLAQWVGTCRDLVFPDPNAVLDLAESEPDLLRLVDGVATGVLEEIAGAEALAVDQRTTAIVRRDGLTEQIRELRTRRDLPPAPPVTRTADRSVMAGSPFWRLVDFAPAVRGPIHGSIEAALAAAGLLDAWVGPAGEIEGHDTFADPLALAPAPGRSLAEVLVPEPDSPVPAEVVHSLLASIAYDERLPAGHPAAIGSDGSWRLGNAHGSWRKDFPAHIGAGARQRAREERLRELAGEVGAIEQAIATLDAGLAALRARRGAVANERAIRPGHQELADAAQAVTRADSDLAAADTAARRTAATVKTRAEEVVRALRRLTALASEHGMPTERGALDALSLALRRFREQADNWLDEVGGLASARREFGTLLAKSERAAAAAQGREEEAGQAEATHSQLAAKLAAVEGTVGADYREILARLEAARTRRDDLRSKVEAAHQDLNQLSQRLGQLESARASDAVARDKAVADRDIAAQRFRHLAAGVLAVDSGLSARSGSESVLSASDGVRAALDAARQVAALWPSVPYGASDLGNALHLLSESVHRSRTTLSARADLNLETDADIQVFTALVDGVRVGAAELLSSLRDDAERSRQEITERERELFDRTLTGDTRRHLADRIRQANELVDRMNARLERVRTASHVAVRLVWQVAPDLPAGTRAARDLLLKDPVRLTEADRDSLHRFFRERIEQAKADNTAASWEQQLEQVFDYTAWHQFVVKLDRSNGAGWQLLTRKLHGALSGGEKAIALHLPLFAAVAAHYQAVPEAPRIILLDEVFVGVDSNNRGQVFALLSALDLDLMLTSDHEWCTYAELGGIGIHQLITGTDGDDAVTTARFTWNGRDLVPDEPEIQSYA
jgi:uncharacterized protein (TIGR02680 family)